MTEVRKHTRRTAAGKMTTVRHHTRDTGEGQDDAAELARQAWQDRASIPHVSTLAATPPPAADCWDDDPGDAEGDWWADDTDDSQTSAAADDMSPAMARLLGCDTPEGLAKYERGRAYREAGYTGPLDAGNNTPDPDDPANGDALRILAGMRGTATR